MPGPSDIDQVRQRALDKLTNAFASGHLSIEEYERRAGRAQNSATVEDLRPLVSDLPAEAPPQPQSSRSVPSFRKNAAPAARDETEPWLVESRGGGAENVACIMSDRRMTGDWLGGRAVNSFTLMGSTTLDLRDTAIPPGRLKIDVFSLMGETKIILPRGLPVKMSAFPFMGEARMAGDVNRRVDRSGSWVEISGLALMASIVVKTGD